MSGGVCQVVGAGVVQVGSDSCRERMWRADENERYSTMNGYMGGGGRKEVEMNYPETVE